MKKFGFIVFVSALTVSLMFSANCDFVGFTGVVGSGTLKTETRNVSGFKAVVAACRGVNLEIIAQKDFSVTVEAEDNLLPLIKTETSGDTLKIYSEDRMSQQRKITVKISMPELNSLEVSGASKAIVTNVKSDSIKLKAFSVSKIKVDGEAKNLESDASVQSGIDAEGLKVENADVKASNISDTTVSATNQLKADASHSSTIYYTGEPKNITKKTSDARSSVKKKQL